MNIHKNKTMKNNSKNSIQVLPKFAIKFANKVFLVGWVGSFLIAVYVIYKIYIIPANITPTLYYSCIFFTVFTATFFGFGLNRLPDEMKVNLSVLIIVIGVSVYTIEIYLHFSRPKHAMVIAEKMGLPWDDKTKTEILKDLRDSGVDTYPNVVPAWLIKLNGFNTNSGEIYPLGGIANITTTLGNESGYYSIIETDEYGFNNPKELYKENKVEIVLLGDSFAEGSSVHSHENISAFLRKSGFEVINLGKGSNGPLIEFATLKEYAEPLKPKIVLWLYYTNDFVDLINELKSPLLKKYFYENNFTQNLISRQEEIDSVLINYVNSEWEETDTLTMLKTKNWSMVHDWTIIIKLYNIRSMLRLNPAGKKMPIFKDILQKSKQMVSGWGGKLYLVYLPDKNLYSRGTEHRNREYVMQTATKLEIPIIDIHKEVFALQSDPLSLFPFRFFGHYNAKGYQLVEEAINNRLKADGIIPLNPSN